MSDFFAHDRKHNRLVFRYEAERLWIEGWGANSLRVRAAKQDRMPDEDWALLPPKPSPVEIRVEEAGAGASVKNGKIEARVSETGKISFYNQHGKLILEEYTRNLRDFSDPRTCSALRLDARDFSPIRGGDYELTARFESLSPGEKLFGMGQYQEPYLNLKGMTLELAQRNSQASVPFLLSSLGYGFLWNNPAVGSVVFGKNLTAWKAASTRGLDYWVTAGDTPAEIETAYSGATGAAPMMPDYGLGFWQCKLRYQTQEELLNVVREYKRRGLPLSVIVIDFFHWTMQGDWKFDPAYWPDPEAMIRELREMGVELMVSIWPTVDRRSENWREMHEKGYLIRVERGVNTAMDFLGNTSFFDPTFDEARDYVWAKAKAHYWDKGVRIFWLDEAEPEFGVYDFDNYRYHTGSDLQVGNIYPVLYAKTFFDGMRAAGQDGVVNLVRCAWAGSQRYGALVWSGDIHSSFESFRNQFAAGLNMGIAGIPWWTTDIGGFHGGDIRDKDFHELFVRWFQWGCFCPVMRLHGHRLPMKPPLGTSGGGLCGSGAENEVWSYGEEVYEICKKYLFLRERLRPYVAAQMRAAHETGAPVMRPLFFDFPGDSRSWDIEDQYMFGPEYLVAPVLHAKRTERRVYLPPGEWTDCWTGARIEGAQTVTVSAPLETIPVFSRTGLTFQ